MIEEKYSAGLVSQSFWFIEMKKFIQLTAEGKSEDEIKRLCLEENLFCVSKEYRAKEIYRALTRRLRRLDAALTDLFLRSDVATQKLINLIGIIKGDRLFFEFLFEVYREKVILGIPVMTDADMSIFFRNKEIQSEDVARWADVTKRKLKITYYNYMTDANLLTVIKKDRTVTPPIMDDELRRCLENTGDIPILKAITGAN